MLVAALQAVALDGAQYLTMGLVPLSMITRGLLKALRQEWRWLRQLGIGKA
ncbi:hypothetical protein [Armatimonas sp.]|uniref:hypothetical protein n=1 Tax=Armatimonas sp. TaxID=1872638 RepID=UPI003750FF7D